MAQSVAVVRANLPTASAGTTDFTKSGFGTPTAAIIITCHAGATTNPAPDASISIGFWDGTNQCVMGAGAADNAATTATRRWSNDAFGAINRDTSNWAVSSITDGIRLTQGTDGGGQAFHCTVLLFSGVSATAGTFTPNATNGNTQESASLGYAPEMVFFLSTGAGVIDQATNTATAILSFGVAAEDGTHRLIAYGSATAVADAAVDIGYSETRCTGQYFGGAVTWSGEITTWGADTFTMTTRDGNTGSDLAFFLALGGADFSFDIGTLTTETSTGVGTPIATDVPVEALLVALSTQTTTGIATSGDAATGITLGLADANGQFAHNISDEDAAGTTNCNSESSADRIINLDSSAAASRTDMVDATVTLNSGDWTPNYSAVSASARKGFWIAFGAGGAGGRTTKNTRSWPLGVNVGMGWRMAA